MIGTALGVTFGAIALWFAVALGCRARGDPARGAYRSPREIEAAVHELGRRDTEWCRGETIGRSAEGRSILALRFTAFAHRAGPPRGRLLVGAQIHAIEFIAGRMALELAERVLAGARRDADLRALLNEAEVVVIPLLNPDGAERVWRRQGRVGLRAARVTARGVDPNRNFPCVASLAPRGWNAASASSASAYHRGPHPLSEDECRALARFAAREGFCASIQLHSIGGVVLLPEPAGPEAGRARDVLATFEGPFQARQSRVRYRPIRRAPARDAGQLDPFLLGAFGTPSVTVEIARPGRSLLWPWYGTRLFWWANPPDPRPWIENDADALLAMLPELWRRSAGRPVAPAHPELARDL